MQYSTQPVILQSAAPTMPPEVSLLQQAGLAGVMAILITKEALSWWRQRGDTQQSLVTTLVQDLRNANQQLIDKIFEFQAQQLSMQAQQHSDQVELLGELRLLGERIDKLL